MMSILLLTLLSPLHCQYGNVQGVFVLAVAYVADVDGAERRRAGARERTGAVLALLALEVT